MSKFPSSSEREFAHFLIRADSHRLLQIACLPIYYKKLISLCRKEAKKMSIAEWELKERQAQKTNH
jgi:hypothetical protein